MSTPQRTVADFDAIVPGWEFALEMLKADMERERQHQKTARKILKAGVPESQKRSWQRSIIVSGHQIAALKLAYDSIYWSYWGHRSDAERFDEAKRVTAP